MERRHRVGRIAHRTRQQRGQRQQPGLDLCVVAAAPSDAGILVEVASVDLSGFETVVAEDARKERSIVLAAQEHELLDRPARPRDGLVAGGGVDHDLGEHRIERGGDGLALGDPAIDAHAFALRVTERQNFPGRRREVSLGGLRIQPGFDGMAVRAHIALRESKPPPCRHRNLLGDEIEPRDHLGDRMLDLQARVHFQKEELAAAVDELHRASVAVSGRAGDARRRLTIF